AVEDAERGVVRAGDAGRSLDDPFQHTVERELGIDRDPGLDERPEALALTDSGHGQILAPSGNPQAGGGSFPTTRRLAADGAAPDSGLTQTRSRNHHKDWRKHEHHHS